MAAMSTVLNNFTNYGDKRIYTTTGHTTAKGKFAVASRKVPVGNQTISEVSFAVSHATEDSEGLILSSRPTITMTFKGPVNGDPADVTAIKTIFRDFVASDEFVNLVDKMSFPAGTG